MRSRLLSKSAPGRPWPPGGWRSPTRLFSAASALTGAPRRRRSPRSCRVMSCSRCRTSSRPSAVTIDAAAEARLALAGADGQRARGGAYTYDWVENLFGLNMHSADEILPQFQGIKVGDELPLGPNRPLMQVEVCDPGRALDRQGRRRQGTESDSRPRTARVRVLLDSLSRALLSMNLPALNR